MSALTIEDLPNEVIIKILRFLKQEDLPKATLTCKLWNDLIESSCLWSLYHRNKRDVNEPWVDFMLTTNRNFGTIKLIELQDIPKNILEIFQKHGFNIDTLHLTDSCIDSFIKFSEILKCMPNLQHLIIFETSTLCRVSDTPPKPDLPNFRKLKTLEMIGSEYSIVNCLQKAKLETLKVLNFHYNFSLDCKPLEDFLKGQEMLKTLAFRSIHHDTSMIFRTDHLNDPMPFRLTRLSLLNIKLRESNPNGYNNLLSFLKPHAKTLRELELGHQFPKSVFEFIFANLTELHTISLKMTELPQDKEFYERLEVNRSIENLIFMGIDRIDSYTRSLFLSDFFKKLPNICSLNVREYCCNEIFRIMAENLSKLKSLTTFAFNGKLFDGVQFVSLEVLQIRCMYGRIDWNEFTKANSRLTELTIANIRDEVHLTSDDIEIITTNTCLESVRLGEHFRADKRFFDILRKKCPNLKILDLSKSCVAFLEQKDFEDFKMLRLFENYGIQCSKDFTLWTEDVYDEEDEGNWYEGNGLPYDFQV